jgi:hypothetical protein
VVWSCERDYRPVVNFWKNWAGYSFSGIDAERNIDKKLYPAPFSVDRIEDVIVHHRVQVADA